MWSWSTQIHAKTRICIKSHSLFRVKEKTVKFYSFLHSIELQNLDGYQNKITTLKFKNGCEFESH